METLRRQIHPEVRILDEASGLARYIASDETIDSYQEVVRAKGWRFDLFKKNAPFVDSHNYTTIENLVGKVTAFQVQGGKLVADVQWAIDAPDNRLARLGWQMTKAGYLKAVSVGFRPVKCVTPSDGAVYTNQLKEMGLGYDNQPRVIYTEQQLLELSSVIIGANGNALLDAQKAGVLKASDVEPILRSIAGKPASKSFNIPFSEASNPSSSMSKAAFQSRVLSSLSSPQGGTPQKAADNLWRARRSGSETDTERALRQALSVAAVERHHQVNDMVERVLDVDPLRRLLLNAQVRQITGSVMTEEQKDLVRAIDETEVIGGPLPAVYGQDLYTLQPFYGAYSTLHVQPIGNRRGIFPVITGYPTASFVLPNVQIPEDSSLAGTSVTGATVDVSALINCSLRLLEDAEADLSGFVLENTMQAIGQRLDTACFIGNGVQDPANGGVTGIFPDATIATSVAASGHVKLENCDQDDFTKVMATVDAATLQRPCRWWVSSALLPALLRCKDGSGKPLLEFHPEAGGFYLLGFPVTLVAVAPSTNAAASKVMAFGDPRAYVVPMANAYKLESSDHNRWNYLQRSFRATNRATGKLRKKEGFATLTTAAS
jgi:hypothetical protein